LRRGRRPYQGGRFAAKAAHADYTVDLDERPPKKMWNESQTRRAAHAILIETWMIKHLMTSFAHFT
jgi:hypothetical protein